MVLKMSGRLDLLYIEKEVGFMKVSVIATTLFGLLVEVGTGQAHASGYTFTELSTLYGGYSIASAAGHE